MTLEEEYNIYINAIGAIKKTNKIVTMPIAAAYLNCSPTTVRRWVKGLKLREIKLNGALYYPMHHIEMLRLTRKHSKAIREYLKIQREEGGSILSDFF